MERMGRLDSLDLSKQIKSKEEYREQLKEWQLKLLHLQPLFHEQKRNVVMVVEGPDAAGKGGVIKRVVQRLDPRHIRVHSVVKPTTEEYQHHYLWRFWNKVPAFGDFAIFDRSWYGRVLVERVEGFATEKEWRQAYDEINAFEKTLADNGSIILKYFIYVSKDEQLKRFESRQEDPYKRWKINDEDWRNREKWEQHNKAAEEMFKRTDQDWAPWVVVEGEYKLHARIKVIKHLVETCSKALGVKEFDM